MFRGILVRFDDTLMSSCSISYALKSVTFSFIRALRSSTFQQDKTQPQVACIVQTFLGIENIWLQPAAHSPALLTFGQWLLGDYLVTVYCHPPITIVDKLLYLLNLHG